MLGMFLRWLFAFVLLALTYNPSEWNYVSWSMTHYQGQLSIVVGLVVSGEHGRLKKPAGMIAESRGRRQFGVKSSCGINYHQVAYRPISISSTTSAARLNPPVVLVSTSL